MYLYCILCICIHITAELGKGKQKIMKYCILFQKEKFSCAVHSCLWAYENRAYALAFSISSAFMQINKIRKRREERQNGKVGQRWKGWFQPWKIANGVNSMVSCMLSRNVVSLWVFLLSETSLLADLNREQIFFLFYFFGWFGFGCLGLVFCCCCLGFLHWPFLNFLLTLCSITALYNNLYQQILHSLSNFCGQIHTIEVMFKLFWMR